ncbi:nuclear transport factor 2 family protein [Myxococcota bacterium]|nr:nuclear transport factor 2 family protein [Myxococcota bacterium]
MQEENPAMIAARSSWRCVQAKDKAGWLALMADDVCIEDPIGVAPTNPSGQGARGKAEVADFWEKNIAPSTIRIETHGSRTAGLESAHELTLHNAFPNGVKAAVRGYFVYRVNEEGLLTNLRGYWDMADMKIETGKGN